VLRRGCSGDDAPGAAAGRSPWRGWLKQPVAGGGCLWRRRRDAEAGEVETGDGELDADQGGGRRDPVQTGTGAASLSRIGAGTASSTADRNGGGEGSWRASARAAYAADVEEGRGTLKRRRRPAATGRKFGARVGARGVSGGDGGK
jgi:hypothetical protein